MIQQRRGFQILGLALALAGASCSDDDGKKGGASAAQSTGIFGQVTDAAGAPIAGATVKAGGRSATTDAAGAFQLKASTGEVLVRVEAEGHLPGIKKALVADGSPTALHLKLVTEAAALPLDATAGGEVVGAANARVTVPAAGLVDADGLPVTGTVQVHLTPIDPSVAAQLEAAPGDFSAVRIGGEAAQLESFGMIDLSIRKDGAKLQVAPGQSFQIAIPAPAGATEPPATMPLWSFNEANGAWVEEGTLTFDEATRTYVGDIGHMSFWNADQVIDTTCISGKVVDAESGDVVPGAYVNGRGADYFGSATTHANADGRFALRVRKSSAVLVLAAHEAGGGEERRVQSGTITAPGGTLSPDDPSCTDGGVWNVRRGSVRFADGSVVSCETSGLDKFAGCIPFQVELATCFAPSGGCTYEAGGLFAPNIVYGNGARTATEINASTGVVTVTYTGAGGRACGTQTTQASATGDSTITITLADGRTAAYSARYNQQSGDITFTCADGSNRTFSSADQAALEACVGTPSEAEECAGDPSGGGLGAGGACAADGTCSNGNECCVGICLPAGFCPIGPPCSDDAECDGGKICCGASQQCATQQECLDSGGCRNDADCGGSACCNGECSGQAFCEGDCTPTAGCGADNPYCCQSGISQGGSTYCSTDASACWSYSACDAGLPMSGQCGDTAELLCCPGTEGSDDLCRTAEDCYAGVPCESDAACGGGLTCCQNAEGGQANTCQTGAMCDLLTPCAGAGAACPSDLFCCTESTLLSLDQPRCLESEAACNFGKPCTGTAECGAAAVCCNIGNDLANALCYPADICPTDLVVP